MKQSIGLWISRRLRLNRSGSSGAGVLIATGGVALTLIIMEFTLAIVVGFKDGIRQRLMGFDAQITVVPPISRDGSEVNTLTVTPQLVDIVRRTLPDSKMRLSLRQPALLKTDDNFEGLILIGQEPTGDFNFERGNIVEGIWPDYAADSTRNQIVISRATASALGLNVGDRINTSFFANDAVKLRRFTVAGIYTSNFGEYDRTVAYGSLPALQSVLAVDSLTGNRLDIRGIDTNNIAAYADKLQQALVDAVANGSFEEYYPVDNITRSGAVYFNWLALLDTNVVVIFILMLSVAALTLISSLFILILERVSLIGTLRALGASKTLVRNIFVDMSLRIVGRGMIIGNIVGIGLLLVQQYTHAIPLNPEMYYLASVPVEINIWAFVGLNIGIAVAAWLILILPARLASSIDPARTLKFE